MLTGYIKPHERHKYDLLTFKRMLYLKKNMPLAVTSKQPLYSAFSVSSRKSALSALVEMNNQKLKKSQEVKPDPELQLKVTEFINVLKSNST